MNRNENEKWKETLDRDMHGTMQPSVNNFAKIIKHDHFLKNIFYNSVSQSIDLVGEAPWNRMWKGWGSSDFANLVKSSMEFIPCRNAKML